ncbi:hypothetical protein KAR91_52375 [Candidatus Pacearchaeota archaeon]|nr:hypothetical protein [Candidatus Pacearchaeota archaeon]
MREYEYTVTESTMELLRMMKRLGVIEDLYEMWGTVGVDEYGVRVIVKGY